MPQVPDNKLSDSHLLLKSNFIFFIILGGFVLRLIILIFAENRVDADEATVGIMALDILEGKDFPFFFHRTTYNGGGAIEAYIGALMFKLAGPSELSLKVCLLIIWTVTAVLFADLCKRTISDNRAFLSVLFFCIGTPFFLEWSLKARGGFAETVLFSVLLLWLAEPPQFLKDKLNVRCLGFGIASGIGIYASEMLLAMVACAGFWLIVRCAKGERSGAVKMLILGSFIGLLPLIIYNLTHDFINLKASVLYKLIMRKGSGSGSGPLSLSHMHLTASFVLGKAYVLLLTGLVIAFFRLMKGSKHWELGHIVLAHTIIYIVAYCLSGLRYLEVPPSRVLYALYPGLAILFAYAADVRGEGITKRVLSTGAIVLWIILVSASITQWISSGVPREKGSWRGSWSLADGPDLYKHLAASGVDVVYTNPWTMTPLQFASRTALHLDNTAQPLTVKFRLPGESRPDGTNAAFILNSRGKILQDVERILNENKIPYTRSGFNQYTILSGLDPSNIHIGKGLPAAITRLDWKPLPLRLDGFN